MARLRATVLFYPSAHVEGRWVAHCLDYDLIGTGGDPGEAFAELLGTIEAQFELIDELGSEAAPPKKAPQDFWDALEGAVRIPPLDIGELRGWADKYFHDRKKKLARKVPQECVGAILQHTPQLALA